MMGGILLVLRLLIAASLYLFLGWVMLSLWQNLRYQKEIISFRQVPEIGLRIENQGSPQINRYNRSVVTIGRGPDCECVLISEKVSAHHARLSFYQNQWWIEDLNSTNGSYLNDEQIFESAVVVDGDHLRCGDVEMTILLQNGLNRAFGG